jgi:hypothetical protein
VEENLRASAFSSLPETICGIEVVPLTLRTLERLRASKSPFLLGGPIRAGHIVAFLWALQKEYEPNKQAPDKFLIRVGVLNRVRVIRAIRRYLFYACMDRPPMPVNAKGDLPLVAFAASMIHHLAKTYGWDDEAILDKPLRRLYQYLTLIRRENNPQAPTFNPIADRLTKPLREKLLADNAA